MKEIETQWVMFYFKTQNQSQGDSSQQCNICSRGNSSNSSPELNGNRPASFLIVYFRSVRLAGWYLWLFIFVLNYKTIFQSIAHSLFTFPLPPSLSLSVSSSHLSVPCTLVGWSAKDHLNEWIDSLNLNTLRLPRFIFLFSFFPDAQQHHE